mmetsp:Transcript_53732/g.61702  ORF Transcript_53732/g.61702 Transcript_53732/m.61702 type:complete len:117 (+) Transcript_53732:286-636(+)
MVSGASLWSFYKRASQFLTLLDVWVSDIFWGGLNVVDMFFFTMFLSCQKALSSGLLRGAGCLLMDPDAARFVDRAASPRVYQVATTMPAQSCRAASEAVVLVPAVSQLLLERSDPR